MNAVVNSAGELTVDVETRHGDRLIANLVVDYTAVAEYRVHLYVGEKLVYSDVVPMRSEAWRPVVCYNERLSRPLHGLTPARPAGGPA